MEGPIEDISNRALIARLYSSAEQFLDDATFDVEDWSQWYAAVQGLTVPEKMVYVLVKLNQMVTQGGLKEYFENSFGIFAPEAIHVLSEIKAFASSNIIERALGIVNPDELLDDNYKAMVFKIELTHQQMVALYSLDVEYDQLQDEENLEDLLGNYLQAYIKN